MRTCLWGVAVALTVAGSGAASAQLPTETVTRTFSPAKVKAGRVDAAPVEVAGTPKAHYEYQNRCYLRLIKLEAQIRTCVEVERMTGGEFHGRMDFAIEPGGKVKAFSSSRKFLETCMMPHALAMTFPPHAGERAFTFIVLVASPECRLGKVRKAKVVEVYPVGTPEEDRAYQMALGWAMGPWSDAVNGCAELVGMEMGFGYQVRFQSEVSPEGRLVRSTLELRGKAASNAIDRLSTCAAPFLAAMRLPKHTGSDNVEMRHGSNTASWDPDEED